MNIHKKEFEIKKEIEKVEEILKWLYSIIFAIFSIVCCIVGIKILWWQYLLYITLVICNFELLDNIYNKVDGLFYMHRLSLILEEKKNEQ